MVVDAHHHVWDPIANNHPWLREEPMIPFYIPLGITLLLITYVPWITTWVPRLALGN